MKFASVFALFLVWTAFAQEAPPLEPADEAMIHAGVGGMASGPHIGVIFKVEGEASFKAGSNDARYILAKIDAQISAGGVEFADVDFRLLGYGVKWEDFAGEGYVDFNLLGAGYTRNLDLGNSHVQRVSLVGIQAKYAADLGANAKLLLNAALDLWGTGEFERANLDRVSGSISSGKIEAGVEFAEKYRIVLGAKAQWMSADPIRSDGGIWCDPYAYYDGAIYDPYDPNYSGAFIGPNYTTCYHVTNTMWMKHASDSSIYARVTAELTKNLQAFGIVSYGVYKISDRRGDIGSSSKAMPQFRFGVNYLLR